MSFASIFAKLVTKDSEARDAADAVYRVLVSDAANDRSGISESRISSVLGGCGKSLADLQAAVDAERRRIADLSVVQRREELLAEIASTNAERIRVDREYDTNIRAIFERHGAAVATINARAKRLNEELGLCDAAERRLVADGPDRLLEIDSELRALSSRDFRLASIGRPQHRHTLRESRVVERGREEIVSKRAALMEERDRIRGEILASN